MSRSTKMNTQQEESWQPLVHLQPLSPLLASFPPLPPTCHDGPHRTALHGRALLPIVPHPVLPSTIHTPSCLLSSPSPPLTPPPANSTCHDGSPRTALHSSALLPIAPHPMQSYLPPTQVPSHRTALNSSAPLLPIAPHPVQSYLPLLLPSYPPSPLPYPLLGMVGPTGLLSTAAPSSPSSLTGTHTTTTTLFLF
ncbi:unnamed protein product [Closterium sp. NIES-65]|nr:unnamed protein product [Closterium sp. NIES-65]